MSGEWRAVGQAPGGPIGAVSVGQSGLIACGSLAGLAISTDGGASWRWPLPGLIGPFVADVAVSGQPVGGIVVACAPNGLARSRDGGDSWELLEVDAVQVALLGDSRLAAVLRDGGLATIDETGASVGIQGRDVTPAITTLAVAGRDGVAWAIAEGRIVRADRFEDPWAIVDLPFDIDTVDLAVTSAGTLLAVGADGLLKRWDPATGSWTVTPGSDEVALVRAASAAPVAVALVPDAVLTSVDAGIRWDRVGVDGSPASAGVSPDGSVAVVGLADGRVLAIDLRGRSVHALAPPPSGLVTALVGEGSRLVAAGFLGASVSSDGTDWQPIVQSRSVGEAVPVAGEASEQVLVAGPDGIVDAGGKRITAVPADGIVALASDAATGRLAVTDGASIWMSDAIAGAGGAHGWGMTPPAAAAERVVALAFGSPGTAAEPSLVAATVDQGSTGTVRLLRGGRWHPMVSETVVAGVVRLASLPGPRGVYAAMGGTLFRPATVGELVLAPERPAGRGETIHALAASRRESGDVVAVLTMRSVLVSYDGGYAWTSHEMPLGPPSTSMGLRDRDPLEVVVARLGGDLIASTID
jgi:hypothetical protein